MDTSSLLAGYDLKHLSVGALGGHSALDVSHGAKQFGFQTVVVARADRSRTYGTYFRTRDGRGCIDEVIGVEEFQDILLPEHQEKLRNLNTLFVHSRYFWVYFSDFARVENEFHVPIVGSRALLKLEERDQPFNQYHLLALAGIRAPRVFEKPEDMDGTLCIVKAGEAKRTYERAFFLATDHTSWLTEGSRLEVEGKIARGWEQARIEEFIIGAHVNFNFFYSPLTGELELLGTDMRRQTNLDGFLRMTADQQMRVLEHVDVKMIETGHMTCTVKESLLEKAFELGEKFVKATQNLPKELDPDGKGIVGPFALQGAVVAEDGREDIVIFDVSFRMPGSPGLMATPYSGYLYGKSMSVGERLGMEMRRAVEEGCVEKLLT